MDQSKILVSRRGVLVPVPCVHLQGQDIIMTGRWLKTAAIRDEDHANGTLGLDVPELVKALRSNHFGADLFSFAQRVNDDSARYDFDRTWDNVAAIPITTYETWLKNLSQDTRRNIRLASKRGVQVKSVSFSDELVRGIRDIYNESPVRQGRPFWHYGKDFETVRRDNITYAERSEFIAGYLDQELVGFIKMVYTDGVASIMQILSKNSHQDKKCTNALIAKAVEICSQKGVTHLVYCKYVYHNNHQDLLTEFKRRNGFQCVLIPRYYVPLSLRGCMAIKLRLQLPASERLPQPVVNGLLKLRARFYHWRSTISRPNRAYRSLSSTVE